MYDPDEARDLLEEELSRPIYQQELGGPIREALEAMWQWLMEASFSLGGVEVPWGPLVLLLMAAAVLTIIIIWVRPRFQRSRAADSVVDIDPENTADQLRARAADFAAAGDHDAAAQEYFRAIVRAAEERGTLHRTTGRTATEVTRLLSEHHRDLTGGLQQAADDFNRSHYGSTVLTREEAQRMQQLDQHLDRQPAPAARSTGDTTPRLEAPR